jgi:N-acetylglucosamine-6-phosphate deacetylase
MRIRARHYCTGQRVDVVCEHGRIFSVGSATELPADREAGWVAPALFDLQINGCGGHSFNSENSTPDSVRHVVDVCHDHGIGGMLATVITNSFAAMAHGLATILKARAQDPVVERAIAGIHLEGPYLSPEDGPRGAHPRQHIRPPDWDEFQQLQHAAGGLIGLVTLAPELDGALDFIERLTKKEIVVAIGHTSARGPCIRDAIRAGARLSTHLGNGSHAMLPRHDNYIWEQLAADELWASLICDGHHLPPAVVRSIVRAKTPARIILTCDASSLAGLPPGRYREWEQDIEVQADGKVMLSGTEFLAGSGVFTDRCVANVMRFAGLGCREALEMAIDRPRKLLGLPERRLKPGELANLILFEKDEATGFRLVETLILAGG